MLDPLMAGAANGWVSRLLSRSQVDVIVAYHQVVLIDDEAAESAPPPQQPSDWLSVGDAALRLRSVDDITEARFAFELWDAQPAALADTDWQFSGVVGLNLPSGRLSVEQIAAGVVPNVFDVGGPGRFTVELAWREARQDGQALPVGFLLARFWRADERDRTAHNADSRA